MSPSNTQAGFDPLLFQDKRNFELYGRWGFKPRQYKQFKQVRKEPVRRMFKVAQQRRVRPSSSSFRNLGAMVSGVPRPRTNVLSQIQSKPLNVFDNSEINSKIY